MEQTTTTKARVTQDFLYEYLTQHNVNMSRLNELMGVSNSIMMGCFRRNLNMQGRPLKFSAANIERMNAALPQLAEQMRGCIVVYGSDEKFTNNRGAEYDPGTVPAIKAMSRYFKLNSFCERVLGWNLYKKESILCTPSAKKVYGHVTADDVARINAEVLAVSGMLGGIEVVADEDR